MKCLHSTQLSISSKKENALKVADIGSMWNLTLPYILSPTNCLGIEERDWSTMGRNKHLESKRLVMFLPLSLFSAKVWSKGLPGQ